MDVVRIGFFGFFRSVLLFLFLGALLDPVALHLAQLACISIGGDAEFFVRCDVGIVIGIGTNGVHVCSVSAFCFLFSTFMITYQIQLLEAFSARRHFPVFEF